ncbi:hypothetical protein EVAR_91811_1 [Eumeta japonica]|uniref:Uncharacterized protein n=1 Tax=Eumeta variegata TaxID=151549 RepID=A0A4C1STZ1_EUMVA|nr:hypothetical protein EVAR_91811_1 [Eumeta japonica]
MVSDENHEFLFDVTARSEIWANSKSLSLNGAKDGHHGLTSFQTMWCPRSRKRERIPWLAADSFQTVPEQPSVAAWALVYPTG